MNITVSLVTGHYRIYRALPRQEDGEIVYKGAELYRLNGSLTGIVSGRK